MESSIVLIDKLYRHFISDYIANAYTIKRLMIIGKPVVWSNCFICVT